MGRTVYELCRDMSYHEFVYWKIHFERVQQQRELAAGMKG